MFKVTCPGSGRAGLFGVHDLQGWSASLLHWNPLLQVPSGRNSLMWRGSNCPSQLRTSWKLMKAESGWKVSFKYL